VRKGGRFLGVIFFPNISKYYNILPRIYLFFGRKLPLTSAFINLVELVRLMNLIQILNQIHQLLLT